jgi:diguanylate cyclase (GGDEF)-like protein
MLDAVQRYDALGNRHRLAKAHAMLAEIATAQGDADAHMLARLEYFRLRDELLGAGATRRVNDLVERLRYSSEQAQIEMLERDNRIQQLQLEQRRTSAFLNAALMLVVLLIALLMALRYRAAVVSNRLLAEKSRALAEQSSALVAANMRLAEQAEQLRRLANEDALTGLPNRGRGMQILCDTLLQARSTGTDLGVMILDIDHFKRFNDLYGHLAGDDVLRQITALMRQRLCDDAIVARLGGEEFLGIVPRAERTLALAESIRRALEQLEIRAEGRILRTTASVGLVRLSQLPEAELPDLLRAADQALYAAKRMGRNRVIAWPDFGDAKVIELHSA